MPSLLTSTRLYKIWADMKQRCQNPKCKRYSDYGGRGIKVCDEWQSYKPFEDWAYATGYREYYTIDRIDNNKGYNPENCRWATYKEQGNNSRACHVVTIEGQTHTISEWADIWGVPYKTAQHRIYRWEAKGILIRENKDTLSAI